MPMNSPASCGNGVPGESSDVSQSLRKWWAGCCTFPSACRTGCESRKAGDSPCKTSPSGGALHPAEAYLLARNVQGVPRGIYHYDALGHRLQEIRRGATPRPRSRNYWQGSGGFRDAAFVVFLAAVFHRTQWKYDYPRAYRAVLAEAGHLCQTFCLTATWLGLAPFCTMAFADTRIEKALSLDGISESVLYAMGAGTKPAKK